MASRSFTRRHALWLLSPWMLWMGLALPGALARAEDATPVYAAVSSAEDLDGDFVAQAERDDVGRLPPTPSPAPDKSSRSARPEAVRKNQRANGGEGSQEERRT